MTRAFSILIAALLVIAPAFQTGRRPSPCEQGARVALCPSSGELFVWTGGRVLLLDTRSVRWVWDAEVKPRALNTGLVVAGAAVAFALDDGTVRALNRQTGATIWNYRQKSLFVRASGAVVVLQAEDGDGVIALDSSSGKITWRHTAPSRDRPAFARLLAVTGSRVVTATAVFEAVTGRVVGSVPAMDAWFATCIAATCVVAERDAKVVAIRDDLAVVWRLELGAAAQGMTPEVTDIVSVSEGVLVTIRNAGGSPFGPLRLAMVTLDGRLGWTRVVDAVNTRAHALFTNGEVALLATSDGTPEKTTIRAYSADTGELRWRRDYALSVYGQRMACERAACYVLASTDLEEAVYRLNPTSGIIDLFSVPGR